MKTLAFSFDEEGSSHLPSNLTAHDRARKYLTGTVHVDDGLVFFLSCNILGPFIREKISRGLLWPRCTKYAKGTIYTNIFSQVNISRGLKKT